MISVKKHFIYSKISLIKFSASYVSHNHHLPSSQINECTKEWFDFVKNNILKVPILGGKLIFFCFFTFISEATHRRKKMYQIKTKAY